MTRSVENNRFRHGELVFAFGFLVSGLAFLVLKYGGVDETSVAFDVFYAFGFVGGGIMLIGVVVTVLKYATAR